MINMTRIKHSSPRPTHHLQLLLCAGWIAATAFLPPIQGPGLVTAVQHPGLDPRGRELQKFYLSLDVEHLWTAGMHVDWETGIADKPDATAGNHTHCSAFVASACERRGVYILRPPQHGQILLANAQYEWLASGAGAAAGWRSMADASLLQLYWQVQQLANNGALIVAAIRNPDESHPGHVALVMPKEIDRARVESEGPMVIMAGKHNFNFISLQKGFKSHLHEWPSGEIKFYIAVSGNAIAFGGF
jgi:hypothetical protein